MCTSTVTATFCTPNSATTADMPYDRIPARSNPTSRQTNATTLARSPHPHTCMPGPRGVPSPALQGLRVWVHLAPLGGMGYALHLLYKLTICHTRIRPPNKLPTAPRPPRPPRLTLPDPLRPPTTPSATNANLYSALTIRASWARKRHDLLQPPRWDYATIYRPTRQQARVPPAAGYYNTDNAGLRQYVTSLF